MFSAHAEDRAQKLVAIQFFLLAPCVSIEAVLHLVHGDRPETSWLGVALAASSIIGMPLLGRAKQRIGDALSSVATKGEGMQNMLCAYLAGGVMLGLLGNALLGCGGWILWPRWSSAPWPCAKAGSPGRVRVAA